MSAELVVGWLAVYAWGKARRVAGRADAEINRALDTGMDRLHDLVDMKLGADPALVHLQAEASQNLDTMSVSDRSRKRVQLALEDAIDTDEVFATDLDSLVTQLRRAGGTTLPSGPAGNTGPVTSTGGGITMGAISAGGAVSVRNKNKVINYAKRNPWVALGAAAVIVLVVWLAVAAVISGGGADRGPGNDGAAAMVGNWNASDGTGVKVFSGTGPCDGFYYNGGVPLDIGGPMTCVMSSKPDAQSRYTLTVKQAPNESSYKVQFDSTDHATVYSNSGQKLYELNRS